MGADGARRADERWLDLVPALAEGGIGIRSGRLGLRTRAEVEVLDLTERIEGFLGSNRLETGFVNVQSRHTTAGFAVNENEPGLLRDAVSLLERLAPRDAGYAHDELHRRPGVPAGERANGHAHAKALLLRSSETLNVVSGRLQLGRWQRVLFLELDGPREREVSLLALGEWRR